MANGKCQVGQIVFAHEPYLHLINIRRSEGFNNGRHGVISAGMPMPFPIFILIPIYIAISISVFQCASGAGIIIALKMACLCVCGPRLMSMSFCLDTMIDMWEFGRVCVWGS